MFTITFFDTSEQAAEGCNHATTARRRAKAAVQESGRPVAVAREGAKRPAYVIGVDGRARPPEGVEAPDCKRTNGRPCFCATCRAERKAAR